MSSPERNQDIRIRVIRAAEDIIRAEGVERLTMRRLAGAAGVALKTPYNLYGSKTAVLISILDEATASLMAELDAEENGSVLVELISVLEKIKAFFGADEIYFRGIFWEIMTSDHPEARSAAHARITALVVAKVALAKKAGEVRSNVVPEALGGQLGLNLLANMGSWAGGHLTIANAMDHTKAVWSSLLRVVATDLTTPKLTETLNAAQSAIGLSDV